MKRNRFQIWAFSTIVAVIFLIGVGSLVRASGSGLGCPDWPKCFGSWIPPLSVDDLPPEFDKAEFNIFQTWTEYINRLVGVVIGILIFITTIFSFEYKKSKPLITWFSVASFILVGFQGWLGSVVVATELSAWVITAHMVVAMVILMLLIFAYYGSFDEKQMPKVLTQTERKILLPSVISLLVFMTIQVLWGTQVREEIDILTKNFSDLPREYWIGTISDKNQFHDIHRSFSWIPLVISIFIWWRAFSSDTTTPVYYKFALSALLLIILQSAIGIILSYYSMPAFMQVLHLTNFSILFTVQVRLLQLTLRK